MNELLQMLQDLAPEIYEIVLRQVYTDAWLNLIIGGLVVVVYALAGLKLVSKWGELALDDKAGWGIVYGVVGLMLLPPSLHALINAGRMMANPQYFVIERLLQ